jgi:hypothetical protein
VADAKIQNYCVKRFAVQARINYAVAIYRLRWLVERDNEERNAKLLAWRKLLDKIDNRTQRIKREIYSNRNQLLHGFRQIQKKHQYLKKVIGLNRGLNQIFKQTNTLRDALERTDNFGRRRVQTIRRLIQNQESKQHDAVNRLKQNYLDNLRYQMSLGGDKVFNQSAEILERKVQNNLNSVLEPNADVETGLLKLAKMMDFRDKQAKNQGLKYLNKSVGDDFRNKMNKLNNLEIIAQNILKSNFKSLEENKNLRRQLLMSNLFSNIEKKQAIRKRNAFSKLIPDGNNPYAYSHFANFVNQFHKRKTLELENQGFNALFNAAC